jgi:hypothetical protein
VNQKLPNRGRFCFSGSGKQAVCKLHVQQVRYALFVRFLIRIGLAYERTLAIRGWLEPAIGASTKTGASSDDFARAAARAPNPSAK